jgi:hypothetical protein
MNKASMIAPVLGGNDPDELEHTWYKVQPDGDLTKGWANWSAGWVPVSQCKLTTNQPVPYVQVPPTFTPTPTPSDTPIPTVTMTPKPVPDPPPVTHGAKLDSLPSVFDILITASWLSWGLVLGIGLIGSLRSNKEEEIEEE